MKAEYVFSAANTLALVGWLLLVFLPRWRWTQKAILSGFFPLLLSIAYLVLILRFFGKAEGGFDSLANVMKLFSNEWVVLTGWIHYLAFDLLVGVWEVKDAQGKQISHWLVIPCLVLTFLLGPIGFLLYAILRFFSARKANDA
jgi:hypothetical protein